MNQYPININGYDTFCSLDEDNIGPHLLIAIPPHAQKDISQICGKFIDNHLIIQVDYKVVDGTRFIKAYYNY